MSREQERSNRPLSIYYEFDGNIILMKATAYLLEMWVKRAEEGAFGVRSSEHIERVRQSAQDYRAASTIGSSRNAGLN